MLPLTQINHNYLASARGRRRMDEMTPALDDLEDHLVDRQMASKQITPVMVSRW